MPGDKVFLSNNSGIIVKGSVLRSATIKNDSFKNNRELKLLFDFYSSRNGSSGSDTLEPSELSRAYRDIASIAGSDNILSNEEIEEFLKNNNLSGRVSINSVNEFFERIAQESCADVIYNSLNTMGSNGSISNCLNCIPPKNIFDFLDLYKQKYNISLVQDIASTATSLGSTRENYINIIRDKIAANKKPTELISFYAKFNGIINNMDMTIFSRADATELDKLIEVEHQAFIEKHKPKDSKYPTPKDEATLNRLNRTLIRQIMGNSELCRTEQNKDQIIDRIMKYAQLNNPKEMVKEFLNSDNETVRTAAQNLLNSTYLDYFPIFVASIIAQESQFRETDSNVFTANGRGVMQITRSMVNDAFERPKAYGGDVFMDRIRNQYNCNDSTALNNAISNPRNISLNYDVGTAGLHSKLYTLFNQIKNGTFDDMKIDLTNPATIMELVAMNYNGNTAAKRDSVQNNQLSQVRYVYGRNVIERFRKYTPADISVNDYFQHNPSTGKFDIIRN